MKTREQLLQAIQMQSNLIVTLKAYMVSVCMLSTTFPLSESLSHRKKEVHKQLCNAKMKLNHYKQLLATFNKAPTAIKQSFKVGDKVRIRNGWQNNNLFIPVLRNYIAKEGTVIAIEGSAYKVRTEIDHLFKDYALFLFPEEALELMP